MKIRFGFVVFLIVFTSCGTAKRVAAGGNEDLKTKEIISSHAQAFPEFNTLAGRVQLVYEDAEKMQSITVSLRMEKDNIIWVKASILGITIAKVLITPESVKYYETIGATYFDGDFALLSEWLGTEIDFQKAQNLLLGQSIFNLSPSKYTVDFSGNSYKIHPKIQSMNFIHSLFLNSTNFKVASETLSQPNENRLLSVRYGAYQKIKNSFYPTTITIDTSDKNEKTKIEINYKKIEPNVSVSFPFEIPAGYQEIQLN